MNNSYFFVAVFFTTPKQINTQTSNSHIKSLRTDRKTTSCGNNQDNLQRPLLFESHFPHLISVEETVYQSSSDGHSPAFDGRRSSFPGKSM